MSKYRNLILINPTDKLTENASIPTAKASKIKGVVLSNKEITLVPPIYGHAN